MEERGERVVDPRPKAPEFLQPDLLLPNVALDRGRAAIVEEVPSKTDDDAEGREDPGYGIDELDWVFYGRRGRSAAQCYMLGARHLRLVGRRGGRWRLRRRGDLRGRTGRLQAFNTSPRLNPTDAMPRSIWRMTIGLALNEKRLRKFGRLPAFVTLLANIP